MHACYSHVLHVFVLSLLLRSDQMWHLGYRPLGGAKISECPPNPASRRLEFVFGYRYSAIRDRPSNFQSLAAVRQMLTKGWTPLLSVSKPQVLHKQLAKL